MSNNSHKLLLSIMSQLSKEVLHSPKYPFMPICLHFPTFLTMSSLSRNDLRFLKMLSFQNCPHVLKNVQKHHIIPTFQKCFHPQNVLTYCFHLCFQKYSHFPNFYILYRNIPTFQESPHFPKLSSRSRKVAHSRRCPQFLKKSQLSKIS